MFLLGAYLVFAFCLFTNATASSAHGARATPPSVTLDGATFIGSATGSLTKFLGIPFAQPPTGDLRFRLPVAVNYTPGVYQATSFGPSCPQQAPKLPIPRFIPSSVVDFITSSIFRAVFPDSEDCLTINVITPASIPPGTTLPVVAWIYGGGFEFGSTSTVVYDGGVIVKRSIDMQKPVVYVSMNYRLSLFGFLASKEVKNAGVGNLGLHDQRQALRWVQKYITQFGGDPTRVTIWGESAGSISVGSHMITNGGNTEGLFRAGFMQSGSPIPAGDITNGQKDYDAIVAGSGCSSAQDTLACLRTVDYKILYNLMNQFSGIFSYKALSLTWMPRTDGVFFTDNPQKLIADGSVANVPIVTGDCDDEGTVFSFGTLNITTESDLSTYIKTYYAQNATAEEITSLLQAYPADITQGSPYGTGILYAITPQYKRTASILGDYFFQAPRRYFINQIAGKQNIWVFLSKRLKFLPFVGSAHATDILNVYGTGEMRDYLINFATDLDPNGGSLLSWPMWNPQNRTLLTFLDGDGIIFQKLTLGQDTYRDDPMNVLIRLLLKYPF